MFKWMFCCFTALMLLSYSGSFAQVSPLSDFSKSWEQPKYQQCNTAAGVSYMSDSEKKVIYILNLARMDPQLFCTTVLKHYPEVYTMVDYKNSSYFSSLVATLTKQAPLTILTPDSSCYASAWCHSSTSGKIGYVGHTRQTTECESLKHFMGECCDFGNSSALDIVMSLLIDQDVESLGHRQICLGDYTKIGVSIQPHTQYTVMSTLDFY